jgi:anti-sigma regulatory factor (Ser/Thr protein kinase)
MWLTEVLQTTTPLGKCPLCGPVQGNGSQESVVRAYPQISIELHYDRRALSVVVEDGGKPFDPTQAVTPHTDGTLASRREGGLGLPLINGVMDDVTYQRAGTINRLQLVKHL